MGIGLALLVVIVLLLASESDEEPVDTPGKAPVTDQDSGPDEKSPAPPQP